MSIRIGSRDPRLLLICVPLALLGCDKDGGGTPPGGKSSTGGAAANACAKGKRGAGEQLVAEARAQRLTDDPPSFADQRAALTQACESGCGVVCLEVARISETEAEAQAYNQKACTHGETVGCTLAAAPELDGARQLCEAGDVIACATALGLEPAAEGQDEQQRWESVAATAAAACGQADGRACSAQAWIACAIHSECNADAIEAASKAAQLVATPEVVETLALVQCHAGELEAAAATLTASCESGVEDSCGRTCEQLRDDRPLLVREAQRDTYAKLLTFIALQTTATEIWYPVLSAMDEAQLADFDGVLTRFVPPISEAAATIEVPDGLIEQFPALVEAVRRSPQLDAKQIKYWYKRLPDMTDEQRGNLFESLRNQWWIIPGEGSRTPEMLVEVMLREGGGLSPTWRGG